MRVLGHALVVTPPARGQPPPRLKSFLNQYPDVSMTLLLDDTDLDLAVREADVAIRMHPPRRPDLVQRSLGEIRWQIFASEDYLKASGHKPDRPEDLDQHRLIPEFSSQDSGNGRCELTPRLPPNSRRARLGIDIYGGGMDARLLSGHG